MKSPVLRLSTLVLTLFILACAKPNGLSALVGSWNLSRAELCNKSVESDHLLLREDGSFRQEVIFRDDRRSNLDGKWTFIPPSSVHLEPWMNTLQDSTGLENRSVTLEVDFRNPKVLFSTPGKGCAYTKPK